jgi:hypothetical protein
MKAIVRALLTPATVAFAMIGAAPTFGAGSPAVIDVTLDEQGAMVGQLVDAQGIGLAEKQVVLWQGTREVARAISNAEGYFHVAGIHGGVYQLAAGESTVVLRAWTAGTAPPSAQHGVLLVAGNKLYRGQHGGTQMWNFVTHPLTLTAGVATAIAVPVVLHNSRRSPASPN